MMYAALRRDRAFRKRSQFAALLPTELREGEDHLYAGMFRNSESGWRPISYAIGDLVSGGAMYASLALIAGAASLELGAAGYLVGGYFGGVAAGCRFIISLVATGHPEIDRHRTEQIRTLLPPGQQQPGGLTYADASAEVGALSKPQYGHELAVVENVVENGELSFPFENKQKQGN